MYRRLAGGHAVNSLNDAVSWNGGVLRNAAERARKSCGQSAATLREQCGAMNKPRGVPTRRYR